MNKKLTLFIAMFSLCSSLALIADDFHIKLWGTYGYDSYTQEIGSLDYSSTHLPFTLGLFAGRTLGAIIEVVPGLDSFRSAKGNGSDLLDTYDNRYQADFFLGLGYTFDHNENLKTTLGAGAAISTLMLEETDGAGLGAEVPTAAPATGVGLRILGQYYISPRFYLLAEGKFDLALSGEAYIDEFNTESLDSGNRWGIHIGAGVRLF
jgi:hypothetical protein